MDNYQKALMMRISIRDIDEPKPTASVRPNRPPMGGNMGQNAVKRLTLSSNRDEITIRQDEDITVTKYRMGVSGDVIKDLLMVKGSRETRVKKTEESGKPEYIVTLDFEDKIDAIKIGFGGMATDLVVPVKFVDADREKYYAKQKQGEEEDKFKKASIGYSMTTDYAGGCLVNIFFKIWSKDYSHTEISFYKSDCNVLTSTSTIGKMGFAQEVKTYRLTGDEHFLAVSDLTPEGNFFKLTQYDKRGTVLLETGLISLRPGNKPRVSPGEHVVTIGR